MSAPKAVRGCFGDVIVSLLVVVGFMMASAVLIGCVKVALWVIPQ